jgi:hypothetical protein
LTAWRDDCESSGWLAPASTTAEVPANLDLTLLKSEEITWEADTSSSSLKTAGKVVS